MTDPVFVSVCIFIVASAYFRHQSITGAEKRQRFAQQQSWFFVLLGVALSVFALFEAIF